MKKLLIALFLVIVSICFVDFKSVDALTSYQTFQQLRLSGGKLLRDYTSEEQEKMFQKVSKRKFMGWRYFYAYQDVRCKYISKTIFSYYNSGTSKINFSYNISESLTEKFSISTTGSISYSRNNNKTTFKDGLNAALKLDVEYQRTKTSTTKEDLNITIDPKSVATLKIVGEGLLSNGYACQYIFWIRSSKGGFEYFRVLTEYPRLEVLPI